MPLSHEQLALRAKGLGASEIPVLLGISPHAKPIDLWLLKRGLAERKPSTPQQEMGSEIEEFILKRFIRVEAKGKRVVPTDTDGTAVHPDIPWAMATPDAWLGDDELVEIKNVGHYRAWEWEEYPPLQYVAQTQWQMFVTGRKRVALYALIGGQDYQLHWIDSDPSLQQRILTKAEVFWRSVQSGEPPIEDPEARNKYFTSLFKNVKRPVYLSSTSEADGLVERLDKVKLERKSLDTIEEEVEARLKQLIEDAEGIKGDWGKVSWSEREGSVSWSAVAKELEAPEELVEKHRGKSSRVFRYTPKRKKE